MSHVNNYIVSCLEVCDQEDKDIQALGERITPPEWRHRRPFQWINNHAGGGKALERDLFIAAFNGLPPEDLISHLRTLEWEFPDAVQVLVKEQDDLGWRVVQVFPEEAR